MKLKCTKCNKLVTISVYPTEYRAHCSICGSYLKEPKSVDMKEHIFSGFTQPAEKSPKAVQAYCKGDDFRYGHSWFVGGRND